MSTENVRIMCPNLTCRRVLAVPPSARGKTVRCRNCGMNIRVPQAGGKPTAHADSGDVPHKKSA